MTRFLLRMRTKLQAQDAWYLAGNVLLVVTAMVRALFLSTPNFPVFDEVHFPYFAQRYLAGQPFFDIHPPLAKWLIALAEWLFGYNIGADYSLASAGAGASDYFTRIIPTILGGFSFSWRFMPYIFGMGLLLIIWQIAWQITRSWKAAFIALLIVSVDSLLFVYGRTGLMDGIMYFFVFASFLACIIALRYRKPWMQFGYLLVAGILAGCAISVKWLGMAALILCFFWLAANFKKIIRPHGFVAVGLALVLTASVYLASFWGEAVNWKQLDIDTNHQTTSFWDSLDHWHQQAFFFNKNLKDSHPYGSSWWSWPLMLRPMLYYYEQVDPYTWLPARDIVTQAPLSTCTDIQINNCLVRVIAAIGNPFLWWASFLSFILTFLFVWPKKSWQWALLLSSICMYLPWMLISRVSFLYYFMGVATVWQLLLAINLWQLAQWRPKNAPVGKYMVITLLVLAALWFLAAYPVIAALPVPADYIPKVLWFPSWRG